MIGPGAWPGLGQLLEREERPQLWRQRRTGARNQAGLTDSDMSGIAPGTCGGKPALQSFTPQTVAEAVLGVRHSAGHCWVRGAYRCAGQAFYPGEKDKETNNSESMS